MSTQKFSSRRQAEDALIEKARTDGAFRAELLSNPRAAIKRQLGIDLPAEMQLKVVEENAHSLYLVLPPKAGSDTLSDHELATVVGGAGLNQLAQVSNLQASDANDAGKFSKTQLPGGDVTNPGMNPGINQTPSH